jgi:hypothetical protein
MAKRRNPKKEKRRYETRLTPESFVNGLQQVEWAEDSNKDRPRVKRKTQGQQPWTLLINVYLKWLNRWILRVRI